MSLWSEMVKPVTDLVERAHFSGEEKAKFRLALEELWAKGKEKVLELETLLAQAHDKLLQLEAQGNWLQRSWRPLVSLWGITVLTLDMVGLLANPLDPAVRNFIFAYITGYGGLREWGKRRIEQSKERMEREELVQRLAQKGLE